MINVEWKPEERNTGTMRLWYESKPTAYYYCPSVVCSEMGSPWVAMGPMPDVVDRIMYSETEEGARRICEFCLRSQFNAEQREAFKAAREARRAAGSTSPEG